ncbi:uncharacterized PE-PGRS family protein PE_PGRS24-like isoform X18 [Ostrea edulis]|uniref:uncharacterized PE-PGRS family protein PE_PGRS24-like isoform X18 n=1 Tax=Ostrea edulis TaxID=37623 RepID=UPI0024AF32DC|nr:uncharacterized PE-PGRS family protein PE_PGRS24-like isoform X18 [Ostrea edulis]
MNRIFLFAVVCIAVVTSEELKGVRRTRHIVKRQAGGGCLYEGTVHPEGTTWDVPCKYHCTCKDGTSGYYSCTEVCPHYDTLPDGCYMQKDPNSQCCSVPKCNFQPSGGSSGGAGQVVSGTSAPVINMGGGSQHSGSFMSGGTCHDAMDNCANYGQGVCSDPTYTQWVKQNCAKYCNVCGGSSGSMSSGHGSTGGGGSSGGDGGFSLHFGTSAPSGGGSVISGGGSMTSGGGSMTSGSCADKISNCAAFSTSVCTDPQYTQWATTNCPRFCNKCGTMTGTGGTMTGTGGTMTGTGGTMTGTGGTMTGTGGTMTGTGSGGTGIPVIGSGGIITGTGGSGMTGSSGTGIPFPLSGGSGMLTGTGGTGGSGMLTGTGGTGGSGMLTGTGGTGGSGMLTGTGGTGGSGMLTGTGGTGVPGVITGTGGTGGTITGTGGSGGVIGTGGTGGTMTGTGACSDKLSNCANYGKGVCSDPTYTSWVTQNCPAYCGQCGGSGTMTGGTGSGGTGVYYPGGTGSGGTGTMTGGTGSGGTGVYYPGGTGSGGTGTMTGGTGSGGTGVYYPGGTGTGGTGTMTGGTGGSGGTHTSTGCVYKNQVYQQGQTWKDGCTYQCTCVDATSGQYSCKGLCVQWNLPSSCRLNPPAAGKCCQTPNCPANVKLNYPAGYVEL